MSYKSFCAFHSSVMVYFFDEIISCFIYIFRSKFLIHFKVTIFICYSYILLTKPKIFNFLIDSSSLIIYLFIFIFTAALTTNNGKNCFIEIYDILWLLNFLYLSHLMQKIFLIMTFLKSIHKRNF